MLLVLASFLVVGFFWNICTQQAVDLFLGISLVAKTACLNVGTAEAPQKGAQNENRRKKPTPASDSNQAQTKREMQCRTDPKPSCAANHAIGHQEERKRAELLQKKKKKKKKKKKNKKKKKKKTHMGH